MTKAKGINRPRITGESFDNWVEEPNASGCTLWNGGKTGAGYGEWREKGIRWLAHRFAWIRANGPIPDGLQVRHFCDTPACVNPAHMSLGTFKDNMNDKFARGRHRGAPAMVNSNDLRWISYLRSLGATHQRIADIIGKVKRSAIKTICLRQGWNKSSIISCMEV